MSSGKRLRLHGEDAVFLIVRVSKAHHRLLRRAAKWRGLTVSAYVREQLRKAMGDE